jgi:glycosyltransferase involved in cell wall biosynthesis
MNSIDRGFSVVTPNLNMGNLLERTIQSVLSNLRHPADEYYVVDGGSNDESIEVIRKYDLQLAGWTSESDKGYADALAKGFRRCTGEYMCWINSGDLLLEGALQAARQALTETGADFIFGDDLYIDEGDKVLLHSRGYVRSLKHFMLYGGWTPLQDACFWRRDLYERVGGIDATLRFAADYDFFLRAAWSGRNVYVPKTFSAFRRHGRQLSTSESLGYEDERQLSRARMFQALHTPAVIRVGTTALFWFMTRWRHHMARRWQRMRIPPGTPASQVQVG